MREELEKLAKWWYRACDAINYERQDEILQDEAESAVEWCIQIAIELVTEEKLHRSGSSTSSLDSQGAINKQVFWERFHNLESGLRSNGVTKNR